MDALLEVQPALLRPRSLLDRGFPHAKRVQVKHVRRHRSHGARGVVVPCRMASASARLASWCLGLCQVREVFQNVVPHGQAEADRAIHHQGGVSFAAKGKGIQDVGRS